MTQSVGLEFEHSVAEAIKQMDYSVVTDPTGTLDSNKWTEWQERLLPFLTQRPNMVGMPSLFVRHGEKVAVVEPKRYAMHLGPIIQARHYADYFDAPVVICVPDDAFGQVPDTVKEWADNNSIVLSPLGSIGDALRELFEPTTTS